MNSYSDEEVQKTGFLKGCFLGIKNAVLSLVFQAIATLILLPLFGYLGYAYLLPVQTAPPALPPQVASSPEISKVDSTKTKVISPTPSDINLGGGAIGFKRTKSLVNRVGLGSGKIKLISESDKEKETPFFLLQPGNHRMDFSLKADVVEGGMLKMLNGTRSSYKISGVLDGTYNSNGFSALLSEGEEDFMKECLIPLIRDPISKNLLAVLEREAKQEVEAEEVIGAEEPFEIESNELALQKAVIEAVSAALKDKFEIENVSLVISDIHKLSNAEISGDELNAIEIAASNTMIKTVVNKRSAKRSSGGVVVEVSALPLLVVGVLLFIFVSLLFYGFFF